MSDEPLDPQSEQPPEQQTKILIVDDDRALCRMMARALEGEGYLVVTAFSGEDGLALFREERPAMVILDFAMPGMNGFEVVNEIRSIEEPKHRTIVVIVTAYSQTFLVSVDFKISVDSYLTKPILPSDLVEHVNDLFAVRRK
jgi:DNA-binding response OmpR family regulator